MVIVLEEDYETDSQAKQQNNIYCFIYLMF